MLTLVSHLESDHGTWRHLSHVEVLVFPAAGVEIVHHHSLILGASMEATVAYTQQPVNRKGQCQMSSIAFTRHYETAAHIHKNIYLYTLTLRLLMSYIYGAPSKARNANVVYIWTYVSQR